MRGTPVGAAAVALALAVPPNASAAVIAVAPKKACYRSGERVLFGGSGFTPHGAVTITLDARPLGQAPVNAQGQVGGVLSLGTLRGERRRLLAATDTANPGIFGVLRLRGTGVAVNVRPRRAGPGKPVRIKARGFTGSKRLYAHVRRGRRYHRNIRIGRLRRACHRLSRRVRIFSLGTRPGVYRVQFDGKRRYSSRTAPKVRYRVTIFRRLVRGAAAAAAPQSWVRIP